MPSSPSPLEGTTHQEQIEHFNRFMCAAQVHTLTPFVAH